MDPRHMNVVLKWCICMLVAAVDSGIVIMIMIIIIIMIVFYDAPQSRHIALHLPRVCCCTHAFPTLDWCCVCYFVKHSLVALLEVRILFLRFPECLFSFFFLFPFLCVCKAFVSNTSLSSAPLSQAPVSGYIRVFPMRRLCSRPGRDTVGITEVRHHARIALCTYPSFVMFPACTSCFRCFFCTCVLVARQRRSFSPNTIAHHLGYIYVRENSGFFFTALTSANKGALTRKSAQLKKNKNLSSHSKKTKNLTGSWKRLIKKLHDALSKIEN